MLFECVVKGSSSSKLLFGSLTLRSNTERSNHPNVHLLEPFSGYLHEEKQLGDFRILMLSCVGPMFGRVSISHGHNATISKSITCIVMILFCRKSIELETASLLCNMCESQRIDSC